MSWASGVLSSAGSAASSAAPAAAEAAGSAASSAAPAAASAGTGTAALSSGPIANTLAGPQVTGTAAGAATPGVLERFASGGEQSLPQAASNFGNNAETYGYLARNLMSNRPQQPQGGFSVGMLPGGNNPYRKTGRY